MVYEAYQELVLTFVIQLLNLSLTLATLYLHY